MENTAIQAGSPPTAIASTAIQSEAPKPTPAPARAPKPIVVQVLERLADLRITVTLFTLSLFLVFFGTLAQVDKGIWTVVGEYFRNWFIVWIPLDVVLLRPIFRYEGHWSGAIPYPGGWVLGGLLLVNLLAAHIVSFKATWKRSGILLIHAGIVVMMMGELITGLCQVEGHMHITQGGSSNFIEHSNAPELAIVYSGDPKRDEVAVIPTARLRKKGTISDAKLPFDIEVLDYWVNSSLKRAEKGEENRATRGQGLDYIAHARPEGAGVDTEAKIDIASMYATIKTKDGKTLGTYLFTALLINPEWIEVDGKTYQVSLRFKRQYKDFTFRLDKLNVAFFQGTQTPKDYSSFIHMTDPTTGEDRDVRIYMNHPFTYQGETFYQSGVQQDRQTGRWNSTTLQVVRNPGWVMPYLSCLLVAGGMLVHFGQNLFRFIERRVA